VLANYQASKHEALAKAVYKPKICSLFDIFATHPSISTLKGNRVKYYTISSGLVVTLTTMIRTTLLVALAALERVSAAAAAAAAAAAVGLHGRDSTAPQITCKVTPADPEWPSDSDWASLNATIDGRLLRTEPAASSCYDGNPFGSDLNCTYVEDNWGFSAFHASQPESIDYSGWANSSCVPPSEGGTGCEIGGLPVYIVNATTEAHVATALAWGSARNLRIVIKNTGHDLNGRFVSCAGIKRSMYGANIDF
jgi:hypothetical protein